MSGTPEGGLSNNLEIYCPDLPQLTVWLGPWLSGQGTRLLFRMSLVREGTLRDLPFQEIPGGWR